MADENAIVDDVNDRDIVEDTDADTRDTDNYMRLMFDDIMRRIEQLSTDIDSKLEAATSKMAGISVASGAVIRDAEDDADDDEPSLNIEDMDLDI